MAEEQIPEQTPLTEEQFPRTEQIPLTPPVKEPPLDLSFTRSQRDMIYVALIAAFLALGLSIIVFANNLSMSRDASRTEVSLRAEVDEKLAIVEDQAQTRLEQARQTLAAETNQFISGLEGRLQRLEARMDELINLPDEVRASLAREMILDIQKRSRILAGQLDQPQDQQAVKRIQELLDTLSLSPPVEPRSTQRQGQEQGQQQQNPGQQDSSGQRQGQSENL